MPQSPIGKQSLADSGFSFCFISQNLVTLSAEKFTLEKLSVKSAILSSAIFFCVISSLKSKDIHFTMIENRENNTHI